MLLVGLGLLAGVELRSRTHCGGGGAGETCWGAIMEGLLETNPWLDDGLAVVACFLSSIQTEADICKPRPLLSALQPFEAFIFESWNLRLLF